MQAVICPFVPVGPHPDEDPRFMAEPNPAVASQGARVRRRASRAGAPAALAACLLFGACAEPVKVERRWPVMGTYAAATVYATDEKTAVEVLQEIRSAFDKADRLMSNWSADSALAQVNRQARVERFPVQQPDLWRCILMAMKYARSTEGAFDPTVGPLMRLYGFRGGEPHAPTDAEIERVLQHVGWQKVELELPIHAVRFADPAMELDLGGIGKGYALDMAARKFARIGVQAGLLDLGGNLYAWGAPPGEEAWRLGVRDPENPDALMGRLQVAHRAVSTSNQLHNTVEGGDGPVGHILDPRTGRPPETDVVSVTVLADSGADADALSTAMLVAGSRRASEFLRRARRVEAILLLDRPEGREIVASASLKGRFELEPDYAPKVPGGVRFVLAPGDL